jgi:hypothetical protein
MKPTSARKTKTKTKTKVEKRGRGRAIKKLKHRKGEKGSIGIS